MMLRLLSRTELIKLDQSLDFAGRERRRWLVHDQHLSARQHHPQHFDDLLRAKRIRRQAGV